GPFPGQDRPQVPGAGVGRRPRRPGRRARVLAWLVAVAVPVGAAGRGRVAVPVVAGPAGRGHRDVLVVDGQRGLDAGVADGQLAKPGQLLEAAVEDAALVESGTAVAEAVADGGVGVAGLGQPDEVARPVRSGGGNRPVLDV